MGLLKDRDRFVKYLTVLESKPEQIRALLREVKKNIDFLKTLRVTAGTDPLLDPVDLAEFDTEISDLVTVLKNLAATY